jgi:hypothetical protein
MAARDRTSSYPPPPDQNPLTTTWYELQREKAERRDLRADLEDFQAKVFQEFKKIELRQRRSGHDLEKFQEDLENSQVRDLRKEIEKLELRKRVWEARLWTLFSAFVIMILGVIIREVTRSQPRTPTPTSQTAH